MIQKITLEIQNDTGVEFEDTTKWDCPKEGEYFINSRHKIEKSDRFSSCYHFVLTPKVDHELEEAKKLIGTWVVFKDKDFILKVRDVVRNFYSNELTFEALSQWGNPGQYLLRDVNPFPLPRWRCFDSDKPERSGYYYLRSKDRQYKKLAEYNPAHNWYGLGKATDYEWLDEGEK